jgi:hypothetical protein
MYVTRMSRDVYRSVLSAVVRNRGRSWNVLPANLGTHMYFCFMSCITCVGLMMTQKVEIRRSINLLKPGYGMHQQVEYFNNCTLCPYSIYLFCICLRTNSDLCRLHKKLIGVYNRDEKCLQCGTDWAFK